MRSEPIQWPVEPFRCGPEWIQYVPAILRWRGAVDTVGPPAAVSMSAGLHIRCRSGAFTVVQDRSTKRLGFPEAELFQLTPVESGAATCESRFHMNRDLR